MPDAHVKARIDQLQNTNGTRTAKAGQAREADGIFGTILPSRTGYPPLELGLTMTFVLVARRWRSLLDEKLRAIGHSASRMEAMGAIAYAPSGTTQIQIAKRIGIEGPTLTRTLDMLEADGLVERLPDPNDRRNKHMKLTPDGLDALAEMFGLCASLREILLEDVPAADIRQNLGFMTMLLERIDGGLAPPPAD